MSDRFVLNHGYSELIFVSGELEVDADNGDTVVFLSLDKEETRKLYEAMKKYYDA